MSYKNNRIKVPRFTEELGFYTTSERSKLMAKIGSKNTKPEIAFRKELWKKGYRYRINVKNLPGKPDIVLNKYKVVVFIDGEFWHGFNWNEKKKRIKSNRGFWIPKIERNMQRDEENNLKLKELGYFVIRFWERDIKNEVEKCVEFTISCLK